MKSRRRRQSKFKRITRLHITIFMVLVVLVSGVFLIQFRNDLTARVLNFKESAVAWVMDTTTQLGFIVEAVEVSGLKYTPTSEVLKHLHIQKNDNILFLDIKSSVYQLMELGWVENVKIQKKLPNTIVVEIKEYEPYAVWQFDKKLQVITENGVVIPGALPKDFSYLTLIIGEKANLFAKNLLSVLRYYEGFQDMVVSAHYVHNRRWRLYFSSNVMVELPEGNLLMAIDTLYHLHESQKILERDVEIIDMRVPNKLIFKSFKAVKKQKI